MTTAREQLRLGLNAHRAGDRKAARTAYERAISLANDADAWHMLGMLQHEDADADAALLSLAEALRLRPNDAAILANRAAVYLARGEAEAAHHDAQLATQMRPENFSAWINLGLALELLQQWPQAINALERAHHLRADARSLEAIRRCVFGLSKAMGLGGQPIAAERHWQRYFALGGDAANAWLLRANAASDLARHAQARKFLAAAQQCAPDDPDLVSAVLIADCYWPDTTSATQFESTRHFAQRFCGPAQIPPCLASASRIGRIGFYSPRFAAGPMASLVLPLLRELRTRNIEIVLYAGLDYADADTTLFHKTANIWQDCHRDDDEHFVSRLRADQLDVLVDLCGHAPGNRLRALAQRVAPKQLSWGDWFATTGVPNLDLFFADAVLIPEDEDRCFSERVYRLPQTRLVYAPPAGVTPADPQRRARSAARKVKFASFNRLSKLTDATLDCWSQILRDLPDAELQLRAGALNETETADDVRARFGSRGIDPSRLQVFGYAPYAQVMSAYRDIDIALDPFPFNGGVTTLDALWMGVPVVSLRGRSLVARQGASLLHAHGFNEWVAEDASSYRDIVMNLAQNNLMHAHEKLHQARSASALFDVSRFADAWLAALQSAD